jgi:hypothetical protein
MLETVSLENDDATTCLQRMSLLSDARALRIEAYFGMPWILNGAVMSAAGLCAAGSPASCHAGGFRQKSVAVPEGASVLIDSGIRASGGCASGPAFLLTLWRPFDQVPKGAVLIAAVASPDLSRITDRLAAAVFEVGVRRVILHPWPASRVFPQ